MKKTAERDLFPGALEMMILQTLRRPASSDQIGLTQIHLRFSVLITICRHSHDTGMTPTRVRLAARNRKTR
jgi:hypothetical protein